jgi:hypothetical protein
VTAVRVLSRYLVELDFADGTKRVIDLETLRQRTRCSPRHEVDFAFPWLRRIRGGVVRVSQGPAIGGAPCVSAWPLPAKPASDGPAG